MLSLLLLVLTGSALEVPIGDLIKVFELGKEAEVGAVKNVNGIPAMESVIDEFYGNGEDYEDAPNTCEEYIAYQATRSTPDKDYVANFCDSDKQRGYQLCPEACNGWEKYFALVKTFNLLINKDDPSRNCSPSNSNPGMCGPSEDDRWMSGDYLGQCPAECCVAGYDHGQCAMKEDLHPECNFVAPKTDEALVFDVNLDAGSKKYHEGVESFIDCMGLCLDNAACDGLTYQMSNHRCWLKEGSTGFEPADGKNYRQSTYMTCCKWTEEYVENILEAETIPAGPDQIYHEVTSSAECKLICQGIDECNGYTYQQQKGRCWVKENATAFIPETDKGLAYRTSAMKICGYPRKEL